MKHVAYASGNALNIFTQITELTHLIVFCSFVRKRRYRETKHSHLKEDDHGFATKESGTAAYDNPAYECNLSIHSTDLDRLENPLF